MTICVFDNPIHSNGGCILADPSLFIIEEPQPEFPGGGGSGPTVGLPGENHFNQSPSVKKDEPLNLIQALQEDEELLIMIKLFVETIRWH